MAKITLLGMGIATVVAVILIGGLWGLSFTTKSMKETKKPAIELLEIDSATIYINEAFAPELLNLSIAAKKGAKIDLAGLAIELEEAGKKKRFEFRESAALFVKELNSRDENFSRLSGDEMYEFNLLLGSFQPKSGETLKITALSGEDTIGKKESRMPFFSSGYLKLW